ncbi:MAG: MoaD family protein [Deltaproteobacteria bacterium]|nr:MoaD family protein [Deltaproteobacteria bacterium]
MTVKYFGDIRPLVGGRKAEEWRQPEPEVRSLLKALGKRHPALENRLWEGDQLSSTMIILVNGRSIDFLNGIKTSLQPDDLVDVFPVEAGG